MQTRNFNVDVLRVLACLLVMWQHASEFFYIGEGGSVIRNANVYAIAWLNSFSTSAVPMFVLISGYFLLPVQEPTSQFLRKRASRVLYPFIFWCIAYAIYNIFARNDSVPTALLNIAKIPVNYGTEVGHLWFVYMLLHITKISSDEVRGDFYFFTFHSSLFTKSVRGDFWQSNK